MTSALNLDYHMQSKAQSDFASTWSLTESQAAAYSNSHLWSDQQIEELDLIKAKYLTTPKEHDEQANRGQVEQTGDDSLIRSISPSKESNLGPTAEVAWDS